MSRVTQVNFNQAFDLLALIESSQPSPLVSILLSGSQLTSPNAA